MPCLICSDGSSYREMMGEKFQLCDSHYVMQEDKRDLFLELCALAHSRTDNIERRNSLLDLIKVTREMDL